jgi:hypothetical protein
MRKSALIAILSFSSLSAFHIPEKAHSEKIYIDEEEFDTKGDSFYIHTGHNVWLQTHTVHRDKTGLYTFESNINRSTDVKMEYEKKWKCPYCYMYWPVGKACANKECPSKYKTQIKLSMKE